MNIVNFLVPNVSNIITIKIIVHKKDSFVRKYQDLSKVRISQTASEEYYWDAIVIKSIKFFLTIINSKTK